MIAFTSPIQRSERRCNWWHGDEADEFRSPVVRPPHYRPSVVFWQIAGAFGQSREEPLADGVEFHHRGEVLGRRRGRPPSSSTPVQSDQPPGA